MHFGLKVRLGIQDPRISVSSWDARTVVLYYGNDVRVPIPNINARRRWGWWEKWLKYDEPGATFSILRFGWVLIHHLRLGWIQHVTLPKLTCSPLKMDGKRRQNRFLLGPWARPIFRGQNVSFREGHGLAIRKDNSPKGRSQWWLIGCFQE